MGQGTECSDRPTEVSVIRFVSRNRTIEEIAPKKEVYTCKQKGCGKIFTNQDEFRTHEALEELKIRFICREPGCGKELPDPGTMWQHYQECHNNETNVFICPYTSCGTVHGTSENLEEHIESCHRQTTIIPTEPEIICFEGPGSTSIEEEEDIVNKNNNDDDLIEDDDANDYLEQDIVNNKSNNNKTVVSSRITKSDEYKTIINDERLIQDDSNDKNINNIIINNDNDDLYITHEVNNDDKKKNNIIQNHRIDLGNLEKVFRRGFECETTDNNKNINSIELITTTSDDEEYTPKKQRMSRCKQEPYKCDYNGCGKMYKYISHYRHHQDSHKIQQESKEVKSVKLTKPKQKASTVSFFLCKIPGCGAQVNNVTSLWKHYQNNHANSKTANLQSPKNGQLFRCKIPNCNNEFRTSVQLYKHINNVHSNESGSINGKTGGISNVRFDDITSQNDTNAQGNFKTDLEANSNQYDDTNDDQSLILLTRIKEESRD